MANKRNGVDVDKWDYLARDYYYSGLPNPFDFHILNFVRALKVDKMNRADPSQMLEGDKVEVNVYNGLGQIFDQIFGNGLAIYSNGHHG